MAYSANPELVAGRADGLFRSPGTGCRMRDSRWFFPLILNLLKDGRKKQPKSNPGSRWFSGYPDL